PARARRHLTRQHRLGRVPQASRLRRHGTCGRRHRELPTRARSRRVRRARRARRAARAADRCAGGARAARVEARGRPVAGGAGRLWTWMPMDAGSSRAAFRAWFGLMLAKTELEPAAPFAVVARESGRAVGSTSFHAIYPEHRRVEIGMTWYGSSTWRSGANVE